MRRVRSTLGSPGYPIVIAAGASLFLLLCFIAWASVHSTPRYGVNVYLPESHFVMEEYNRNNFHIITITPGENPRIYIEGRILPGGLDALPAKLDEWAAATPGRKQNTTIIIEGDPAVSYGTICQLDDMILKRQFSLSHQGRPAVKQ